MNRKALSPLVATILLIAFAIALGVVVMNWGRSYIEERADFSVELSGEEACEAMEINVIKVAGKDKVCYDPDSRTITAFVENIGSSTVNDLKIRIIGSVGIESAEGVLMNNITPGDSAQVEFEYPASIGMIQQLKITPISAGAECIRSAAVSESISQC